jgi:hypothetical protein
MAKQGDPGRGCLSEFSPGSVVEEHHVLLDGLAADAQLIGGEVRLGVADRQAAQDRQFRRDRQLRADDLGMAPGTVKSLARLYDPGTTPRPLHDGPHRPDRPAQAAGGRAGPYLHACHLRLLNGYAKN